MNCKHTGPHMVLLNGRMGNDINGPTIAQHARVALNHAFGSDPADIDEALRVLDRADTVRPKPGPGNAYVEVNDAELAILNACLNDAADYMGENNYADDGDFPEDMAAARVFDGYDRVNCWTDVVDLHRADQAVRSILAAGDLLYDEAAAINAGR